MEKQTKLPIDLKGSEILREANVFQFIKSQLLAYRWGQIRHKLGLDDFKFHDLRKTFGSVLAQNGVSTAVTQKLLEHSSPDLTNKVYTNVDPVLRHAVDQIPAGDWL